MKKVFIIFVLWLSMSSYMNGQEAISIKATSYRIVGKTASGLLTTKIKEPFLAMSRDLIDVYPLHSYVELSNCKWAGIYKVMDKMGKRHNSMVDIFSEKKRTGTVDCDCRSFKP